VNDLPLPDLGGVIAPTPGRSTQGSAAVAQLLGLPLQPPGARR